jgi:hypothetical protein
MLVYPNWLRSKMMPHNQQMLFERKIKLKPAVVGGGGGG